MRQPLYLVTNSRQPGRQGHSLLRQLATRSAMAVGRALWTFVCLVLLWLRPPILVLCTKVTALTLIGAGLAFLLAPGHGIHWKLLGVSFLSFCLGFGYGLLVIWVTGDTGEG